MQPTLSHDEHVESPPTLVCAAKLLPCWTMTVRAPHVSDNDAWEVPLAEMLLQSSPMVAWTACWLPSRVLSLGQLVLSGWDPGSLSSSDLEVGGISCQSCNSSLVSAV